MSKTRILVVEDEAITAAEIESCLLNSGYDVTSIVSSGEEAIKKAEEDSPDLVMMDIRLQGDIDGIETAEVIRNRLGTPIIFLTAYLDEEKIQRAKITMPFGYLLKPVQERDIKATVEMALYAAKIDAERKMAEEALKRSESKLSTHFRLTPMGVIDFDNNYRITSWNPAAEAIFGYSAEEAIGKSTFDLLLPEYEYQKVKKIHDWETETASQSINDNRTKDGRIITCQWYNTPILDDDDNVIGLTATCQDITGQLEAERKLKQSEEQYRTLISSMSNIIFLFDDEDRFIDAHVGQDIGLYADPEQFRGKTHHELMPDYINRLYDVHVAQLRTTGKFQRYEYPLQIKDGKKWYSVTLDLHENKKHIIASISDVTDRKEAELKLAFNYNLLRMAGKAGKFGGWSVDLESHAVQWSEEVARIHDMPAGYSPVLEEAINFYTPEWQERISLAFQNCVEKGLPYDEEMEIITAKGTRLWVRTAGEAIRNDKGEITHVQGFFQDIDARKKAEEAKKESDRRYRDLFENTQTLYYEVTLDGILLDISPSVKKYTGYTREELTGKSILDLYADPKERDQYVEKFLKYGEIVDQEIDYKTKKGSVVTGLTCARYLPGEGKIIGSIIDITDRKSAEKALRESEAKYRNVVENAKEAICVIQDRTFKYFNPEAVNFFGYPAEELSRLSSDETIHAEDRELVDSIRLRRLKGERTIGYSHRIITRDKQVRWADIRAVSITWEDQPALLIFIRDITEQKRTRELIIQSEKIMSLGSLAAGMAHEINNPLGGILQGVQNLQRRLSPDFEKNMRIAEQVGLDLHSLQPYLKKRGIDALMVGIMESGLKAARIISRMLQFSRKSDSSQEPADLVPLLENAIELAGKDYDLKKQYDFRNIKIIKEFDPDLPAVPCVETEIEQVFLNLLNNAAWAMANSENLKNPCITLRLISKNDKIIIEIEDNGPGMDEKTQNHLFEPFYTTKPVGQGTGLGLYVSYMIIVNNHKGTMEVQSQKDKGTTFRIQLPGPGRGT